MFIPSLDRVGAEAVRGGAHNLRRIFALRNAMIALQVAGILVGRWSVGPELPVGWMSIAPAALALANATIPARLRRDASVRDAELFGHLLVDLGALTFLLYFSGGWNNPFVSLYLLPLAVAATVLPPALTWTAAGAALGGYTLIVFRHVPLPVVHPHHGDAGAGGVHAVGMWLSFVFGAAIIAFFVSRMASSLRERERALAAAREKALRDEQILALGALAAGAAHELSTPLSTIAVLAKELEHDRSLGAEGREGLGTLRAQVEICKQILTGLLASAGQSRAEGGGVLTLTQFVGQAVERWQVLRPQVPARFSEDGLGEAPRIVAEQTLGQALLSLLNNAADASPEGIEVLLRWDRAVASIEIADRGQGIPAALAAHAGRLPVATTKEGGHGLGLMLASAAIERLGGAVTLAARPGRGTCTRVVIPLRAIAAAETGATEHVR